MDRDQLTSAIGSGLSFIDERRSSSGCWSDFVTPAGPSTEWVTAFILYSLRRGRAYLAEDPAVRALWRAQRASGGWGYNAEVPPDCDSTGWTLLALAPRNLRPSAQLRAEAYVVRHQDLVSGGFSTYAPADEIHRYIEMDSSEVTGWSHPHTCVTGVALQALLVSSCARQYATQVGRAVRYLLRTENDGAWESYWWKGSAYVTCEALRGLALAGAVTTSLARRVRRRLLRTQQPDGGWADGDGGESEAFATALNVRALALLPDRSSAEAILAASAWLLRAQNEDAGWPAAPILRIPAPMVSDPGKQSTWRRDALGTGVILSDGSRLFTTAAVVRALLQVRSCWS